MGAYDNPQRVTNRSFDALILGGKSIANKLALTSQEITNNIKKQKEEAKAQQALLDQEQQSMFSAVNEVPSTGDPKLDNNIHSFWNTKVDEYYKIKNEMDAGITGRQEGNMKLAKIKALVGQFKTQAAYLATQASGMGTALKNGTLSSTGSVENRNVLSAVGQGGDVRIVERNGQIFYMLPKFDENGEEIEGEGDLLNGAMLSAYAAQYKDLYNEKADFADYETQMYNNLATPNDPSSDYVVTDKFKKGSINPITGQPMNNLEEGYEYTMQYILPNKKDDYLAAAVNSPMMNTMINDDEAMLSEWQDNIPDGYEDGNLTDEPNSIASIAREIGVTDDSLLTDIGITMDQLVNSSWHEYPSDMTSDQRQKLEELQTKIAKTYIARQSFDNNAIQQGTLKSVDRSKIKPPKVEKPTTPKSESSKFTTDTGKEYSQAATNSIRAGIKMEEEVDDKMRKAAVGDEAAQQTALVDLVTSYGFAEEDFEDEIEALDFDAITQSLKENLFKDIGQGATSYAEYQVGKADYNNYLDNKKGSKVKYKGTGFNANSYKNS